MRVALLVAPLLVLACSETAAPPPSAGASAETESPKDSPMKYKVLADDNDKSANTSDYHILITDGPKHDDVDGLLKFLYRHLMTRRDPAPSGISASVYSNEAQYKTPPRSPIATVVQKPGDVGPTFDNKVPLEFWQQIDQALEHSDKGWKLEKKVERNDAQKTLTITVPYTEPGKDAYADALSFNMAMNVFTDITQALFEKVPELHAMTFVGKWKDEEVVNISVDRTEYQALKLNDVDEQIGQLHGRVFLELATNKSNDAKAAKANAQRIGAVYKKMLAQLKGHATVSPKLK
jgi:hypothetical protein